MPRISGESLQEHREQLRRRVFEAFAELMAERSFDAISMAALAERAEVGRTSIYHHFPDKEAVVVAFASHETERYLDELRSALDTSTDPVQRLRLYLHHQLAAGQQFHMGLGMQLVGMLSGEALHAIREHVVAVEDVLRGLLEDGVAAGVFDVPDLAATMSLVHAALAPRDVSPEQVDRFVLRALEKRASSTT